jgi:PAS domain S-box-containing protein
LRPTAATRAPAVPDCAPLRARIDHAAPAWGRPFAVDDLLDRTEACVASRQVRLSSVLACLVLIGIVPLAGFAGWLLRSSWREQRALIEQRNLAAARAVSVAIDQYVESAVSAIQTATALRIFEDHLPDGFSEIASHLLSAHPDWDGMFVADAKGRVLAHTGSTPPLQPSTQLADGLRRAAMEGRAAVSGLLHDPVRGYLFVVAVPRQPGRRYVIGAEISVDQVGRLLQWQTAAANGVITLSDASFQIMARTKNPSQYVGRPDTSEFAQTVAGRDEGSWRNAMLEGTPAYSSFRRSPLTGWVVGVGIPASEIEGPIRASFQALVWAGVAILSMAAALGFVLVRTVVRDTRIATGAAHALAAGRAMPTERSRIVEVERVLDAIRQASAVLDARVVERDEAERQRALAAGALEEALAAERAARVRSEEHEARLSVTLQSIADGVIAASPDGRVTMINAVAQALTGWSAADAIGERIARVLQIDEPRAERLLASLVTEHGVVHRRANVVLRSRTGRDVPVEQSAAAIRGADGAMAGFVLVLRDISTRREAERQRAAAFQREQAARRQAEALSRGKDEFIATMSHELRTPLNAIFGWVKLLRSGALDESGRARALEVIERNTRTQTQLVEDLLDMSRIITGRLHPELQRIALVPAVEAAVESVRPTADTKGITLEVVHDASVIEVGADPERLQQIIWNILVNAIKFTPGGGRVDVSVSADDDEAVIAVRDTGIGIAADVLPRVFDQFWQASGSESRTYSGLGIGLSLVRRLVELHGGSVRASSAGPGHGATFTVRLPIARAPAHEVVEPQRLYADTAVHEGRLTGVRTLVVDDDRDARDLVAVTLSHAGADVAQAASVAEAIQAIDGAPPHLIVSDIAMPNASGYDLVRHVRGRRDLSGMPLVALTAYGRTEDRQRAMAAGFDYYLGKPIDPAVLVQTVATAAGR